MGAPPPDGRFVLMSVVFLLEGLHGLFQQVADGQILRADALAETALEALGGLAVALGEDGPVVAGLVPILELAVLVQAGEDIRDQDPHRAAVGAVAAGGAGDQILGAEEVADLLDRRALQLVQGLRLDHEGEVVVHLVQVAHAGEDHRHLLKARGEAQSHAGRRLTELLVERYGVFGQTLDERAALDRLHDDDRLAVADAGFVDALGIHGDVAVVQIVELDLDDLDLRVGGQDLVQDLGGVVEGQADVADLALALEFEGGLIGAAGLELLKVPGVLGVHQIEVEVFHPAGLELANKDWPYIIFGRKHGLRKLAGKEVTTTRIARR